MSCSESIIKSFMDHSLHEGLSSVAASKLGDLARGFVLKARPIIVMHRIADDSTVSLKLKRGLINHILLKDEGSGDKQISKSPSAAFLLTKVVQEVTKLGRQGYIEI